MTKNPHLNALFAALYIVLIVLLITYGPTLVRGKPDTILAPIAVLFLLVLSVAFMFCAFFLQPIMSYLDGQKKDAVKLFTKTLLTFTGITAIIVTIAFTL